MNIRQLIALLLFTVAWFPAAHGQGTGDWERTDLFGNPNSLNVYNEYPSFLLQDGAIILSAGSPGGGYWAKYTLQGQLLWQRRARGALSAFVGPAWRDGAFAYGATRMRNQLGYQAEYYWFNGRGDTIRVRAPATTRIDHLGQHAVMRDGRYYIAGAGDGNGTGQSPLALHYSLVCLDTAGNVRWQRQYLNPSQPSVPILCRWLCISYANHRGPALGLAPARPYPARLQ